MCAENDPEMDIYNLYGDSPNTPKTLVGDMAFPGPPSLRKKVVRRNACEQT